MDINLLERLQLIKENPEVYTFLSDDELASLLISLVELSNQPPEIIEGPQGEKGDAGETGPKGESGKTPKLGVDYLSRRQQEEMIQDLVDQIEVRDGKDAEITEEDIESIVSKVTSNIEIPEGFNDNDLWKAITKLEEEIAKKTKTPLIGGGGVSRTVVQNIVDSSITAAATPLNATLTYSGSQLTQVTNSNGNTDLNYTGSQLTTVDFPDGTIGTLTYTGSQLTSVTFA